MYRISKFLPYLLTHLVLGLAGCFVYSFFLPVQEVLLPIFLFSWKVHSAILIFIFYFPFIYTSALIFAYPIIFGKYGPAKMERRSLQMSRFIRHFFIFSLIILSVYVVLGEVVKPILIENQTKHRSQTFAYTEYTQLAKDAYARDDYTQAEDHIKRALSIWPKSEEAVKLSEAITISNEKRSLDRTDTLTGKLLSGEASISNMTAEAALRRAENAALLFDFYTAHYYAKLAAQTFEKGNPLIADAEKLAKRSWEEVEKGLSSRLDAPLIALYKNKKAAYEALQNGEYIKAYYAFLQIDAQIRALDADQKDPEVERFLSLSQLELTKHVFFTDELKNIPNFTIKGDINFILAKSTNEYAKIKIHGISHKNFSDRREVYLMNMEYTREGLPGSEKWSIFIPYAKLIEVADSQEKNKLMLQVCSVDRYEPQSEVFPEVLVGSIPAEYKHNIILPMTLNDFLLIEKAVDGPSAMKLSDLYYFSMIAEKYGFKKEAYLSEVLYRLAEPLLLLIVSLSVLILTWRFRVSPGKRLNKKLFIFSPLCPFLAYILVETIKYICKLQIAFFVFLTPRYVSLIVFSVPIIFFICLTITLLYQRSE